MKVSHIVHKIRSLKRKRQHIDGQEEKSKNVLMSGLIVVAAVIVAIGIVSKWSFFLGTSFSMDEVKTKAEQFIVANLSGGKKAEIKEIFDGGRGLYKVMVQLEGGQGLIESYVTKDAKLFFPSVIKMDLKTSSDTNSAPQASADVPKSDTPTVELFVMSYCPFGTQIEKGIIPALETLGNSVNFQLKFVDYTLHGKKEFDENIKQYCIEKEYPKNLIGYLKCFTGENGDTCLAQNAMSATKINNCVSATDKKYKLTELYNKESGERGGNASFPIHENENKAYGVTGSPTLVINGTKIESARDSASLLSTMCNAFNNKPSACATELSSVAPGAGFGNTPSSNTGSNANCN